MQARITRNYITKKSKPGKSSSITDDHIQYLVNWFTSKENIGKPFKWAFKALKTTFKFD